MSEQKIISEKLPTVKNLEEWMEIEDLILMHQKQSDPATEKWELRECKKATEELIKRFFPLFKKYLTLIKTGQIDFNDTEMRRFVRSFIGEPELKFALLKPVKQQALQQQITQRFNFIKETYGSLEEDEIMLELQMLFLVLAKRYKQMGRNFCAYLYNAYSYEVTRHIMRFTKNPANIHYRNIEYEDFMEAAEEPAFEEIFEDKIYESTTGVPDISWISGETCSDTFQCLTPLERKIIIKYYIEDYNDRQIADEFAMHINSINLKRRKAVLTLAEHMGINLKKIKRSRKSGKQALNYHKTH